MTLTSWPRPEPIKYSEETRQDNINRTLKLSEIGKLHELKSILSSTDKDLK